MIISITDGYNQGYNFNQGQQAYQQQQQAQMQPQQQGPQQPVNPVTTKVFFFIRQHPYLNVN